MIFKRPSQDYISSEIYVEDVEPGQVFSYGEVIYMKLDKEFLAKYMNVALTHTLTRLPLTNVAIRLTPISSIPKEKRGTDWLKRHNNEITIPLSLRIQIFALGTKVKDVNGYHLIHKSLLENKNLEIQNG